MTRKHFIEIAKILGQFTKSNDDEIVKAMIYFLTKQNPYFNIPKFKKYVEEVRNKTQG